MLSALWMSVAIEKSEKSDKWIQAQREQNNLLFDGQLCWTVDSDLRVSRSWIGPRIAPTMTSFLIGR